MTTAAARLRRAGAFDPLSMGWHTCFWTGGPRFAALGISNGAAVSTWPDEINNHDAAQATATKQPILVSVSAGMGNRPIVQFDGVDDFLATASFASLGQPNEIVMVGRTRSSTGTRIMVDGIAVSNREGFYLIGSHWTIFASTDVTGGATDTTKHFFDVVFDATDSLTIDGISNVTGNAGAEPLTGLTLGSRYTGTILASLDLAFLGLSDTLLTAQNRTDLLAWSRKLYGTA